ncbi:MAG: hypothetical protein HC889_07385 [Synechococcaceae cyanobacterium SM1_2_3]|nr:hypothetical protein [Synechococcaceae cyanobacterium SM1_2_3]
MSAAHGQRGCVEEMVGAQDAVTNAWHDATPTVAKISSKPMNLRRTGDMTTTSLGHGKAGSISGTKGFQPAFDAGGRCYNGQ